MIKDKKSYRILVIEDNPPDLALVEEFLTEQILDPVIVHADSFKQASAILSAGDILFDVILLDLSLPDNSGQDLITDMLQVASSCPIIILTGYADIDFSIKSISQGILDYLLKDDLNAITLYKSIIYAIERKKTISDLREYINTIEDQNKKLREIAWMQSHVVRAPLSRMMMLIELIKSNSFDDSDNEELLNNVLISAAELDNVIRDISNKIAN
jgi:DNA-binding NtrC family response regulator